MHLDWQLTSPALHAARQAVMAACWEDWALATELVVVGMEVVAGGTVPVVDWADATARRPAERRVMKRIVGGCGESGSLFCLWEVRGRRVMYYR
jgi:hypothetical protein